MPLESNPVCGQRLQPKMAGMDINSYPVFRPIEKRDKPSLDRAFRENPPEISEFTFTNIYSWRDVYKFALSAVNGLIILRSDEAPTPKFFDPIGRGDVKAVISRVLKDFGGAFVRLPGSAKSLFDDDSRFTAGPDPNNADYLYRANDLISLPGKKYDGKRNLIKKFKAAYEYEYIEIDGVIARDCLKFEEIWCAIKNCDNVKGLDNERRAVREMLANFSEFGLMGGAIKVEGVICALAVGERLNPNTLVMHMLKAEPDKVGLYQTIMNEFLSRKGRDFEYVNLEQDLGEEGLRRSKMSYHPVTMIKKYTIR